MHAWLEPTFSTEVEELLLQVVVKTELLNCLREEQKRSTLKKVNCCKVTYHA